MAATAARTIPLMDLSTFVHGNADQRNAFASELGKAFHEVGFVGIINHGIPKSLVDDFYANAKKFFALDVATKRQYEVSGLAGQRGYTSFGKEHAKQAKVADLKEFFQIGQTVTDGDPVKSQYPDNAQTAETPDFTRLGDELYKAFEGAGAELLRAIALYMKLGEHYFDQKIHNGNSILRAIHYPPILEEPASAIRAEQHEDINLITLLVGASAGGLQLLDTQNQWLDITPEDDEIVATYRRR